ncbi:hypothetical protein DQW77_07345 [Roseovarius sp. TE539]|uniref:hypothetical protein n=1 Tax=Roseovarius sp. TE539 TaxID=2249812 RepID=UPI000DDEBF44|nr:hypothetical protein [Roseovarius sp. TE539]RBI74491.1 hypothetical protein DQW77_07345 [Roseovarius sp. TE539]
MAGNDDQRDLDVFFEAARERTPDPSAALLARIAADADATQAGFRVRAHARRSSGRLRQFLDALGGWPAAAGLAAATLAGMWIGFDPPGDLQAWARDSLDQVQNAHVIDIMPGTGLDLIGEASL